MDGPTLRKFLELRKSYLDRACAIVADLAHAGGPCPDPTLTLNCRDRAERLVGEMNELHRKRKLAAARGLGRPRTHFAREVSYGLVAECNVRLTSDGDYKLTLDAHQVTCRRCMETSRWKKTFDQEEERKHDTGA
jgi:hypothetical protein